MDTKVVPASSLRKGDWVYIDGVILEVRTRSIIPKNYQDLKFTLSIPDDHLLTTDDVEKEMIVKEGDLFHLVLYPN